jgi:hypothetical protein
VKRGVRVILGMIILVLSCALLIWGLLPARREVRTQPISPTDLQLPTPSSLGPSLQWTQPAFIC